MKLFFCALCFLSAADGLSAQKLGWQPSLGHTQMPIWPGAVPDAQPAAGPESVITNNNPLVAGRPWISVERVSEPTMTVYCLLYTSPSPRDGLLSRMPSSA